MSIGNKGRLGMSDKPFFTTDLNYNIDDLKKIPFTPEDFMCKCGCGKCNFNPITLGKLALMATLAQTKEYKVDWHIDSACRCESHNRVEGGKMDSAHLSGQAVDLRASTSRQRYHILKLAMLAGFTRIGVSKGFIHLDDCESKDPRVVWLY